MKLAIGPAATIGGALADRLVEEAAAGAPPDVMPATAAWSGTLAAFSSPKNFT